MCNGYDRIYVERRGKFEPAHISFVDNDHLMRIIDKIASQVGRRVDGGVADGRRAPPRREPGETPSSRRSR